MKPTKKQKLRWINEALKWIWATSHTTLETYTCDALNKFSNDAFADMDAWHWYRSVLMDFLGEEPDGSCFEDFETREQRTDARILWLSFLHLWVSEGVIK